MLKTKRNEGRNRFRQRRPRFFAAAIILTVLAGIPAVANSARLTFEPGSIGFAVTPGEETNASVSVALADFSSTQPYASFNLDLVDGSMNRGWIATDGMITLRGVDAAQDISFAVTVPADTPGGTYTGILRPTGIHSSERITADTISLNIEVIPKTACNRPPTISDVSADETMVRSRNKKPLTFSFSGTVESPDGCVTEKVWYELVDEYGEEDDRQGFELDDQGRFKVAIPVIASRKGNDRDGRLYTVTFVAENEAGIGYGGQKKIVISHDNRK